MKFLALPRVLLHGLLAAALAVSAFGCGKPPADDEESGNWGGAGTEESFRDTDPLAPVLGAKGLPLVYVLRQGGEAGVYSYRVQGAEYSEREFLGLCRSILRDNPSLVVRLVPAAALSNDEVGLVAARIRETGVPSIKVLDSNGRERL